MSVHAVSTTKRFSAYLASKRLQSLVHRIDVSLEVSSLGKTLATFIA